MASQRVAVPNGSLEDGPGGLHWLTCNLTDATNHSTTAITATGATDFLDIRWTSDTSIGVNNGATNVCTFTVEGSLDGINFFTVAYGSGSSGAYTQSPLSVTGGSKAALFLPPEDFIRYVRVNISAANANGTTFTVYGRTIS